MVDKAAAVG